MLPGRKQKADKMDKLKLLAFVVVMLLISFSLISMSDLDRQELSPAEKTVKELLAPLQNGVTSVDKGVTNFFGYFTDIQMLQAENRDLEQQVGKLNGQLATLKELMLENQRLRSLLDIKSQFGENFEMVSALVIGRDPSNWYRSISLDKGSLDGIQKDMAVVTHEGLVGRIINVTPNTAEVLLILDHEGAVGGRIQESRITPGVVEGIGDLGLIQLIHLAHDAEIEEGQTVITSGLGGIFPRGLKIGKIVSVELEPDGLLKKGIVQPFVDFSRLEEVLIIKKVIKFPDLLEESPEVNIMENEVTQSN